MDFAGSILGQQFFVVVDALFKWIKIRRAITTLAAQAITVLRMLFAKHGLCDIIMSDNDSAFAGTDFGQFITKNDVKHVMSALFIHAQMKRDRESCSLILGCNQPQLTSFCALLISC